MLRAILNPDLYHGHNRTNNFFEGWYFKLVDSSQRYMFAFIPGIFKGKDERESHSFLQIINGTDVAYNYVLFPAEYFRAELNKFQIAVGENAFSTEQVKLQINEPGFEIAGEIRLSGMVKWPDSILQPGSMGYYNFLTFMQCYSQVCAMHADLAGTLVVNGTEVDFTGGTCYIEKNWGRDFPYSWVWVQSNNFSQPRATLSCSIAHIPFFKGSFRGFLIGLYANDTFYKFTTMGKSTLDMIKTGRDVILKVRSKTHTLWLQTYSDPESFVLCKGPRENEMIPFVEETLQGKVDVVLTENKTGLEIFRDQGYCAGIEYGGKQEMIFEQNRSMLVKAPFSP